jgi:uncharacterized protein (DUF1330 family)
MAAFAIIDLEIYDIELYLAYHKRVRPLLASVGARYLARGGQFRVFDGDYQPNRLALVEFPSLAAMEDFYASAAYQALEPQRKACSEARIIGVEGLDGAQVDPTPR